jgi:NADPH:quinone reductase-like Zn-dependent oxidoreductase
MQAIVQERFGAPEVLELRDIDQPEAGDCEVLVRVHAASVNPADWYAMTGIPYIARPQMGMRTPKTRLGLDLAGVVEALGGNVARLKPGDEVFGAGAGTLAEYVAVEEDGLVLKPADVSFEQAAAVPVAGLTALQGLRDKGRVQPRQQVLINGASGGVGTFAVQVAKSFGAEVTACAAPGTWTWSVLSAPTRSSTTPKRTSPSRAAAMTCCSTSPGAGHGQPADASSTHRRPWSSSVPPKATDCSGR